jgi:kinesin family protein 5
MLIRQNRFEAQLTAVKERLEAAKSGSTRGLGSPTGQGGFSFGGAGSRIAKPLRGGGAAENAPIPIISGLQNEASGNSGNKRSSWFFSGGQK